jgi:hypothetical protein
MTRRAIGVNGGPGATNEPVPRPVDAQDLA